MISDNKYWLIKAINNRDDHTDSGWIDGDGWGLLVIASGHSTNHG